MENLQQVAIDIAAGVNRQVLKAAADGQQVRLRRFWGTLTNSGSIQFRDTDGTPLSGPLRLGDRSGFVEPGGVMPELGIVTATGKGLVLHTTGEFGGFAVVSQK